MVRFAAIGFLFVVFVVFSPTFATAAEELIPPAVNLEKAVHFVAPDGSDVLMAAGLYQVEAAERTLRLIPIPGAPKDVRVLEAQGMTHVEVVEAPVVVSEHTDADQYYLALMLPGGKGLVATGSYSGVRSRIPVTLPSQLKTKISTMTKQAADEVRRIRFFASGTLVYDRQTGLAWEQKPDVSVIGDWAGAGKYCSAKGMRLPRLAEFWTLRDAWASLKTSYYKDLNAWMAAQPLGISPTMKNRFWTSTNWYTWNGQKVPIASGRAIATEPREGTIMCCNPQFVNRMWCVNGNIYSDDSIDPKTNCIYD